MLVTTSAREAGRIGASMAAPPRTAICGRPSRPCGRAISTIAITRNSATSVNLEKFTENPAMLTSPMPMQSALTSATRTAAIYEPTIEPMPPITTTTKASRDDCQIHAEIGGLARDLQRAAEAGEQRAKRKDGGEQHRLIDAERAQHFAVFGGGAHQPAETRAREHRMQHDQHQRRNRDQENIVARHAPAENFNGAAQAGCARTEQVLRSPQPQRRVVDDQKQREGGEKLKQFRRGIDAAATAVSRSERR